MSLSKNYETQAEGFISFMREKVRTDFEWPPTSHEDKLLYHCYIRGVNNYRNFSINHLNKVNRNK